MNRDQRPDPDHLLRAIKRRERHRKGGRLSIFFGMSAGVGKTYAMLRAAQQRRRDGVDVVIGCVVSHGRSETSAMMEGLPAIPLQQIDYRGTTIAELDLDAILTRRPQLVLVDELAHTNAPGVRHPKRYLDVLELLDAGIDVFTTLNVQHLESRKETVERITNVPIRETVPDSILDRADSIELIDLPPGELLKRLKEGKVYLGDMARIAVENFFKEDTLTALRQIALRMTAERVDTELQDLTSSKTAAPWSANERLMVAISHSPHSIDLIRAARRLAYNLESPWLALYIDTGKTLKQEDRDQLAKNIALARELGADVMTVSGIDIPGLLQSIAAEQNVTHLVVGRPNRHWFLDLLTGGSLLDRLVHRVGDVEIHVLRRRRTLDAPSRLSETMHFQSRLREYFKTTVYMLLVFGFGAVVQSWLGYRSVGFIFLLAVTLLGLFASMGPVVYAAFLSALVWDFLFIPPIGTFYIQTSEDLIMCGTYFVVSVVVGLLSQRARRQERILRERQSRSAVLYQIVREIASGNRQTYLADVCQRLGEALNGQCLLLLKPARQNRLINLQQQSSWQLDQKEEAVAAWCLQNLKPAGWSTDTLASANGLYIPLQGLTQPVGVLVYRPSSDRKLTLDEEQLLFTVARQLAISMERELYAEEAAQTRRLQESEQLHQTLLNSISHELRTPLTAIVGAASALLDHHESKSAKVDQQLAHEVVEAARRLNRIVDNLLDMSRLNAGVLSLNLDWHDLNDLITGTLKNLQRELHQHSVKVTLPSPTPLIRCDYSFLEHALANLLLNAAAYSPEKTTIEIVATLQDKSMTLQVRDRGPGIPPDALPHLFDKFFRGPGSRTGGVGLGLTVVKGIVEAHHGSVSVVNLPDGGACFSIVLPYQLPPAMVSP